MKYLKLTRYDGVYEYIPLSNMQFGFVEVDENEYRVEINFGRNEITLFEKLYISDVDKYMIKIMEIPDGVIVEPAELL
jgi:hypothetical protein